MAVFRVIKDKDNPYIMINKYYIYDNRLSLKAKGLMSYFLSRPDDWEFYVEEIKKNTKDKETSITGAIKELLDAGYIRREAKRGEKGKFKGGYDYTVYETPIVTAHEEGIACTENIPKPENPEPVKNTDTGKHRTGKTPIWGNQRLLNKDFKLNKEIVNSSCSSKGNLEVFKHFEKCGFGLLSSIMLEKIVTDIEMYGVDWVMKAAEKADEAGKHNYNYIKGILENWKANGGIKLKNDRKKSGIGQSSFNVAKKESTFNAFKQREYDFDDLKKKLLGWDKGD